MGGLPDRRASWRFLGTAHHCWLEHALPQTVRIGGSRAQRDLVEMTLVAAYIRADRPDQARALVARRADRQPAIGVVGYH